MYIEDGINKSAIKVKLAGQLYRYLLIREWVPFARYQENERNEGDFK